MKDKLLLISFGILLGSALAGISWFAYQKYTTAGTHFESLAEFHRVMLERDERDIKSDRSVSLRSIIQPNLSEKIMFELRPNLSVKFQGVPLRTNSDGMRAKEIAIKRSADSVYRIALLGDSFAFGWGVAEDKMFAAIIEAKLNQETKSCPRVEVLNFAVPGYSTFQEASLFLE